jgi:3'(2'), 5'-bisphosphate nucleotidase
MKRIYDKERLIAIKAVALASRLCQQVFSKLVADQTLIKNDKSPVTIADFGSQALINAILQKEFPADPIVAEEDAQDLIDNPTLLDSVLNLSNSVVPGSEKMDKNQLLTAIDAGKCDGALSRFWTLDPIDGTKGFLRGEQFAVCLALIEDGKPQVSVMGCPNLPTQSLRNKKSDQKGCLFVAVRDQGAYQLDMNGVETSKIRVSSIKTGNEAVFCESVEAGHSSQSDTAAIAQYMGITTDSLRMDSQCKYALVARGDCDLYMRVPVDPQYQEKIWDHASGSLLVEEAGGIVSDLNGKPLDFMAGKYLSNNKGIMASNSNMYDSFKNAVVSKL